MNISERLNTIIHMVKPCGLLADIGCDHGYVCIRTVENGQAKAAIASDVAEGPLKIAGENIAQAGLKAKICTVLADGLSGIPEDARPDCIVMTGIGGLLMKRILSALKPSDGEAADPRFADISQMVLGPQSDIDAVRHFLVDDLGVLIEREVTVFDDGKYYTLLDVKNGGNPEAYSESEYMYGKHIDPETLDVYKAFLAQQKQILRDAYHGALKGCSFGAAQAISDIKHKIALVDEAAAKFA